MGRRHRRAARKSWSIIEPLEQRLLLSVSPTPAAPDLLDAYDSGVSQVDNLTNLDNSTPTKALGFSVSGIVPGATVTVYADGTAIGSAVAGPEETAVNVITSGSFDLIDSSHAITAGQVAPGMDPSEASASLSVNVDTAAPSVQGWALDKTFDVDGRLMTPIGTGNDCAYATAIQGDGRIVAAGYAYTGSNEDFALARYNADGSLDTSFGSGGKVVTDFGTNGDCAYAVAIQADGKIVAAGSSGTSASTYHFTMARYNGDGSLDTAFGTGGTAITTTWLGRAWAMAIQADGRIILSGSSALARYNADGTLDTSFGTGGKVGSGGYAVTVQPDGKIVTCTDSFLISRYQPDGMLDTSFSGDGTVSLCSGIPYAVRVQSDGKIVAAGYCNGGTTMYDFALARCNADGSLDTTFGNGGQVTTIMGAGNDVARGLAITEDGKIVAAGYAAHGTDCDFVVARYNPGGTLDTSFDVDGRLITPTFVDYAYAMAVQDDGRIVLAGYADSGTNYDFALVRYAGMELELGTGSDTGLSTSDRITSDNTPTIQAVGASPYFRIYREGSLVTGPFETHYAWTSPTQADGTWRYTTTAIDAAGNESAPSQVLTITIDTEAPAIPATPDLQAGSDLGISDTDDLTADNTPTFTVGGGTPYCRVYRNGVLSGSAYQADSAYTTSPQPNGTWSYTATAVDEAGNESAPSGGLSVTISTQTLAATGAVDLLPGSDTGVSTTDNITGDNTPTFGLAAPLPYFRVYCSGNPVAGIVSGANYTLPAQPDGTWSYTIRKADAAGNESADSAPLVVTVDTAVPGMLDCTFSGDGIATTAIGTNSQANAMALQSGGKIVVAGYSQSTSWDRFALARYTSDGALDASFGTGGVVTTLINADNAYATAVAVQADGKIVAAGYVGTGTGDFALVRYNASGTLDTTFSGDGMVTTSFGADDHISAMAIQPDGKIVVVGYTGYTSGGRTISMALARYTTSGALDATFGTGGMVTTAIGSGSASANALAVQPDGKIVVAGYAFNGLDYDFALLRYNPNGTLDSSFGLGGVLTTAVGAGDDHAHAVAVGPDGKIIAAGDADIGSTADFAIVRYDADGSVDTTFGAGGMVTTAVGDRDDAALSVVLQRDQKIVVAGYANRYAASAFALARYTPDGALDATFDGDGILTTAIGSKFDNASAVALQSGDRILVAGRSQVGVNMQIAVARYVDTKFALQGDSDTGALPTDGITRDRTPTFSLIVPSPYFRVYRDGTLISGLYESGSTFTPTTAEPDGAHNYTISAVDAAGNESALSEPLAVTIDTVAPQIVSAVVNRGASQRSMIKELAVTFSEDVGWSLAAADLTLYNQTLSAAADLSGATMTYDSGTHVATWDLSAVTLPDGFYELRIAGAAVADVAGNLLDGAGGGAGSDWTLPVLRFAGDADGDGFCDVSDLGIMGARYDTGGNWWELPGDFNCDGWVDVSDLGILGGNYDTGLAPLGGAGGGLQVPLAGDAGVAAASFAQETQDSQAAGGSLAAIAAVLPAGSSAVEATVNLLGRLSPMATLPGDAAAGATAISEDAAGREWSADDLLLSVR